MLPITVEPYTPETAATIDLADAVFMQIIALTPESLGAGEKEVLLMTFGSVAMEHLRAIIMLCRSQVATGSAFALFRVLVDTITRGEWLYRCATHEQVERFMRRSLDLSSVGYRNMANEVDLAAGLGSRMAAFAGVYKHMSDYAHTGHDAVARRLAPDGSIEPTYPEEQVRLLVSFATYFTVQHFMIACEWTGHEDAALSLGTLGTTFAREAIPSSVFPESDL